MTDKIIASESMVIECDTLSVGPIYLDRVEDVEKESKGLH